MAKSETIVSFPELLLIAGSRVVLGLGLGLLMSKRLSVERREGVGWALFGVGVLSTIPLAFEVFSGRRVATEMRLGDPCDDDIPAPRRSVA